MTDIQCPEPAYIVSDIMWNSAESGYSALAIKRNEDGKPVLLYINWGPKCATGYEVSRNIGAPFTSKPVGFTSEITECFPANHVSAEGYMGYAVSKLVEKTRLAGCHATMIISPEAAKRCGYEVVTELFKELNEKLHGAITIQEAKKILAVSSSQVTPIVPRALYRGFNQGLDTLQAA